MKLCKVRKDSWYIPSSALKFGTCNSWISVAMKTFLVVRAKSLNKSSIFFKAEKSSPECKELSQNSVSFSQLCFPPCWIHSQILSLVLKEASYASFLMSGQIGNESTCFTHPEVPADMSLALIGSKFVIKPIPVPQEMWCWEESRLG